MSESSISKKVEPISKVSIQPINAETLVVSIRSIVPQPEDILKMSAQRRSGSLDSKKKFRKSPEKMISKSTMTDYKKEISISSQTSEVSGSCISKSTLCLKHASENISLKSADMKSEKASFCDNCSKSMLSYIFVVQDFLDSLATEICGESKDCYHCMREKVRQEISAKGEQSADSRKQEKSFDSNKGEPPQGEAKRKSNRIKHHKDKIKEIPSSSNLDPSASKQMLNIYSQNFVPPATNQNENNIHHQSNKEQSASSNQADKTREKRIQNDHPTPSSKNVLSDQANEDNQKDKSFSKQSPRSDRVFVKPMEGQQTNFNNGSNLEPLSNQSPFSDGVFIKPMERQQPNFNNDLPSSDPNHETDSISKGERLSLRIQHDAANEGSFQSSNTVTSPFGEEKESIVSSLSNVEREVYDSARDGAGWESLSEPGERLVASDGRILSEAYVTMCRNNAEALGCLVVGTSLLLTQTSRTLCVIVSDGVSMAFRDPLSSVFHVVQTVRALDSLGTTKLALLEQPELGITFDKLNVWRLKQFHKCVYLNPDTLVIQNCDELFNAEELSAVPDIGWPDCFNSGVFVFSPSENTFWQLLQFSDKQGSYDGGDQGLLNSFFSSWNSDINKKLSFIYNLMANVGYTYTPAYKQFGKNVKIVQFHGTFKPWHVKFFNQTGLISPASNVHPNYVEFVNKWIKIFKGNSLRQLSKEIQSYAASQELICAVELLRFFPLPSESEAEFFLTPPSVRLRLTEMKLNRVPTSNEQVQRRKSAEFPRKVKEEIQQDVQATVLEDDLIKPDEVSNITVTNSNVIDEQGNKKSADNSEKDSNKKSADDSEEDSTKIPGSEVGNYQGMQKWEQGKMDYQGTDSSDTIIKRLEFLMSQPKE